MKSVVLTEEEMEVAQLEEMKTEGAFLVPFKAPEFKKLRGKAQHYAVAQFWVLGYDFEYIAKMVGVTPGRVRILISTHPQVKAYIEQASLEHEERFKNLFGRTVKAISDALDSRDPQIALAGASLYLRASGRMNQKVELQITAEDIVKGLLAEAPKKEEPCPSKDS